MVWVDQPAGTGFSPGPSTVRNEDDVARQFLDFWRNFVDAFQLQGRKVYLTGESYAGMYIPYIASHMLDEEDKVFFDVAGAMIYAPFINAPEALQDGRLASFCLRLKWWTDGEQRLRLER
jgi:carboxypeptidase D